MQSICTLNLMLKLGSSFPFNMGMLFLIWRELGMGKFPHSWLSSHSETEFLHSRLRRSWRNTLSLFLLSHSWGNFFSRLRGFATQGGKIPSLILSRWEIAHFLKKSENLACHQHMSKSIPFCQLDGKEFSDRVEALLDRKILFRRVDEFFFLLKGSNY